MTDTTISSTVTNQDRHNNIINCNKQTKDTTVSSTVTKHDRHNSDTTDTTSSTVTNMTDTNVSSTVTNHDRHNSIINYTTVSSTVNQTTTDTTVSSTVKNRHNRHTTVSSTVTKHDRHNSFINCNKTRQTQQYHQLKQTTTDTTVSSTVTKPPKTQQYHQLKDSIIEAVTTIEVVDTSDSSDLEDTQQEIPPVDVHTQETTEQNRSFLAKGDFTDFICIQEHWLFKFEQENMGTLFKNVSWSIKSVDDNNPIPPIQKPRGYGGVAILWKDSLNHIVEKVDDGSEKNHLH
ncbi:unnamed protein product [Mytilus edulis]|uniref:Uncharacterized protein n=1 Tax=Mytilus edulis TaxID=6550 RepID=A0A8S3V4Y2_MYTED|nr:unnamed protein product [Mytilus edulis]